MLPHVPVASAARLAASVPMLRPAPRPCHVRARCAVSLRSLAASVPRPKVAAASHSRSCDVALCS
eukprot:4412785-Prymnesium_polylepis.1